jgi:hypothetical protein
MLSFKFWTAEIAIICIQNNPRLIAPCNSTTLQEWFNKIAATTTDYSVEKT